MYTCWSWKRRRRRRRRWWMSMVIPAFLWTKLAPKRVYTIRTDTEYEVGTDTVQPNRGYDGQNQSGSNCGWTTGGQPWARWAPRKPNQLIDKQLPATV
ncbi:hypothetical protein LZ30DRAFT_704684 [Colletotrichum cereale]|nr:hypothetical protein LZ30DRAFT_704684 [Colletotrichum cereale]